MEQVVLPLPAMLLMLSPHFDMQMCGPLLSAMLQNEQYIELSMSCTPTSDVA